MQVIDCIKFMDGNEKIAIHDPNRDWNWTGTVDEIMCSQEELENRLLGKKIEHISYSGVYNAIYFKVV